jgi:uncharacterized membrane protein YgdD (TMEM256/DUF423 family)
MRLKPAALAAVFGASGVALGAFGAHALKSNLAAAGTTSFWDKAVLYQLVHAVALLALEYPLQARPLTRRLPWAARAWAGGILAFSGSLYGLALGGPRWLGPLTPLGGISLIAGWILVGIDAAAESDRKS